MLAIIRYRKPAITGPYSYPVKNSTPSRVRNVIVAALALASALALQLYSDSIILGALVGFLVFTAGGVVPWRDSQDAFTQGSK